MSKYQQNFRTLTLTYHWESDSVLLRDMPQSYLSTVDLYSSIFKEHILRVIWVEHTTWETVLTHLIMPVHRITTYETIVLW